uniref:Uncharacterized protein n=1 Tax=Magnetococcus massalia (strain MO-1) TaxID=451514 RepID=A0A1S7LHR3_MAGMO|nr:protein of unknown function [Candidatus Magnetococcus massalia]
MKVKDEFINIHHLADGKSIPPLRTFYGKPDGLYPLFKDSKSIFVAVHNGSIVSLMRCHGIGTRRRSFTVFPRCSGYFVFFNNLDAHLSFLRERMDDFPEIYASFKEWISNAVEKAKSGKELREKVSYYQKQLDAQ